MNPDLVSLIRIQHYPLNHPGPLGNEAYGNARTGGAVLPPTSSPMSEGSRPYACKHQNIAAVLCTIPSIEQE